MLDFLLPRSDLAVVIQFTLAASVGAIAIWRSWTDPDRRIFSIGATVLVIALLGVRAVH